MAAFGNVIMPNKGHDSVIDESALRIYRFFKNLFTKICFLRKRFSPLSLKKAKDEKKTEFRNSLQ